MSSADDAPRPVNRPHLVPYRIEACFACGGRRKVRVHRLLGSTLDECPWCEGLGVVRIYEEVSS